jgi:hypothetical protein
MSFYMCFVLFDFYVFHIQLSRTDTGFVEYVCVCVCVCMYVCVCVCVCVYVRILKKYWKQQQEKT